MNTLLHDLLAALAPHVEAAGSPADPYTRTTVVLTLADLGVAVVWQDEHGQQLAPASLHAGSPELETVTRPFVRHGLRQLDPGALSSLNRALDAGAVISIHVDFDFSTAALVVSGPGMPAVPLCVLQHDEPVAH